MKESKVEEFIRKVDRPWGMSMTELEQFQSEVKQLKFEQNKVAIEKLEELEKAIRGNLIIRTTGYDDNAEDDGYNKCVLEMVQLVREQIKELKGDRK